MYFIISVFSGLLTSLISQTISINKIFQLLLILLVKPVKTEVEYENKKAELKNYETIIQYS